MSYENVEFNYNNFCIGAISSTFCSIDTTNATAVLQVKNDSGAVQANYDLNPTIPQGVSVKSLEYPGPRSTSNHADGMPFWTLERDNGSQCTIKQWSLDDTLNRLDLEKTIIKSTGGSYYYNCNEMALEYYQTSIDTATLSGSGKIKVDSTSNMEVGDTLYLGLSSNVSYIGDFESVDITSISGSWLYITSSGSSTPPHSVYNNGDDVCFVKSIYLFSNESSVSGTGSLIKLDLDGNELGAWYSAIYKNVEAAAFGWAYVGTLAFVRNSNLLYLDIATYDLSKSASLDNIESNEDTLINVYDIALTTTSIYRLQESITLREDDGTKTDYSWSTYNYHQSGVYSYVNSITMWAIPAVLANQENTLIYALVRDQYGAVVPAQTVYFDKESGDASGSFDDLNKQGDTNASGIATIGYTAGWYDPAIADSCCDNIYITGYTNGSNVYTGSQYVWDAVEMTLYKKFIGELVYFEEFETTSGSWPSEGSDLYCETYLNELEDFESDLYVPNLSKFQFPGGDWVGANPPSSLTTIIKQLNEFDVVNYVTQLDNEFSSEAPIDQLLDVSDTGQLSQTYISRHTSGGHQDTASIAQFRFIIDAIPAFWSEKNPIDTNIWIKLAPYGFSLNQSTLVFKVKEVYSGGSSGWINYEGTSYIDISTWDAGGGLLGLEVEVNPPNNFHHNAVVHVYIEVYDTASVPNIIVIDYWFKIVPDFKAPYITNESPERDETSVSIDTDISFDIIDLGAGVDLSTLEFYVNNRSKIPTTSSISNGYHISYSPSSNFYYGETVEISVRISDLSEYDNILYDMWRFYVVESSGPWFDSDSFDPRICSEKIYRKHSVSFNVYEVNDMGIDGSSILVYIGGKQRKVQIIPIIYRLN
jgi:hypothetical protein